MTVTVGDLIRRARHHHPSFTEERHPNVVCLSFLETRQRELLKELAESLKDRLSASRNIADTIDNELVGVDSTGVAYAVETSGDGYDVIIDDTGFCYTGPTLIAQDPYADGFPFPVDAMKVVAVYAVAADSERYVEVEIIPEGQLPLRSGSSATLFAFLNAWRLVPVQNPPSNTGASLWDQIESVTITWVDRPTDFTRTGADWADQEFTLPDPYVEPLEWEVAAMLAWREVSRDDATVPVGFAQRMDAWAAQRMALNQEGAKKDHRSLRFVQTRRNR